MVKYLTYEQYTGMGGTLPQATFDELSMEAQAQIDWYTFNRLQGESEITDERVFQLMYRLVNLIYTKMVASAIPDASGSIGNGLAAGIASQSNDGVSISYNVRSAADIVANSQKEIEQLVSMYLQGVTNNLGRKVLYRGLYPYE